MNLIKPIYHIPPEQWLEINDTVLPNIRRGYYISTLGRVYSAISTRIMMQSHHRGYLMIGLYTNDGNQVLVSVHRIVMIMFHPIPNPQDMQVNHRNGIKYVNDDCNLEWVTAKENISHAISNNLRTGLAGEDNAASTITCDQVVQICELLSTGSYTFVQIADIVGCSSTIVGNIYHGKNWKAVSCKYPYKIKKYPLPEDDMNKICLFFQNNSHLYDTNESLYRAASEYIGETYNERIRIVMRRLKGRLRYNDITKNYNY